MYTSKMYRCTDTYVHKIDRYTRQIDRYIQQDKIDRYTR